MIELLETGNAVVLYRGDRKQQGCGRKRWVRCGDGQVAAGAGSLWEVYPQNKGVLRSHQTVDLPSLRTGALSGPSIVL